MADAINRTAETYRAELTQTDAAGLRAGMQGAYFVAVATILGDAYRYGSTEDRFRDIIDQELIRLMSKRDALNEQDKLITDAPAANVPSIPRDQVQFAADLLRNGETLRTADELFAILLNDGDLKEARAAKPTPDEADAPKGIGQGSDKFFPRQTIGRSSPIPPPKPPGEGG